MADDAAACSSCGAAAAPPSRFCPGCGAFIPRAQPGILAGRRLLEAGHLASPAAWLRALLLGVPGLLLYAVSTGICLMRVAGPYLVPTWRAEAIAVLGVLVGAGLVALAALPRSRRRYALALVAFPFAYLALSHLASLIDDASRAFGRTLAPMVLAMAAAAAVHLAVRRSYRD